MTLHQKIYYLGAANTVLLNLGSWHFYSTSAVQSMLKCHTRQPEYSVSAVRRCILAKIHINMAGVSESPLDEELMSLWLCYDRNRQCPRFPSIK